MTVVFLFLFFLTGYFLGVLFVDFFFLSEFPTWRCSFSWVFSAMVRKMMLKSDFTFGVVFPLFYLKSRSFCGVIPTSTFEEG